MDVKTLRTYARLRRMLTKRKIFLRFPGWASPRAKPWITIESPAWRSIDSDKAAKVEELITEFSTRLLSILGEES